METLELMKLYGRTLVTAFVQVYVAVEQEYQVYLQPSYWQYISTESNPIHFVDSSAVLSLTESYNSLPSAGIPHDFFRTSGTSPIFFS